MENFIKPETLASGDRFGASVEVQDDRLFVGSPGTMFGVMRVGRFTSLGISLVGTLRSDGDTVSSLIRAI